MVPFTTGLKQLPSRLDTIEPFGATSLHDAIGETAERLEDRPGLRRAVVVFTDGVDTASRRRPEEVSAVASAIDVPVYIFGDRTGHRQSDARAQPDQRDALAAGRRVG